MTKPAEARADSGWIARLALAIAVLGVLLVIAIRVFGDRAIAPTAPAQPQDVATMIAKLEKRLAADPNDVEGWKMLGWSNFETRHYATSAQAYAHATMIAPGRAELWSALGEARVMAAGSVGADAHGAFAKALTIDPKDPRARYFLAVEKDVAGDHRAAIDAWLALLNDAPPGAPWVGSVHALVAQVAAREKIDIAGRLPPMPPAAAGGEAVASAAIPGPTAEDMAAARQLPPAQQDAMVRGMVDRLAARLASDPRDAAGWIRLMRARMVLGDGAAASQALASAKRAFNGDKAVLAQLDEAARTLGVPHG